MTNKVIQAIEQSELFKSLNESAKKLYKEYNRNPSEEEYRALRNMIIAKVMMEDLNVKEVATQEMYKELRG